MLALIRLAILITQPLLASKIEADMLTTSTITAQQPASGIYLSSHAYLSPNSSITLRGTGHITSASSITASSFFGDGTNLSSIVLPASTNTFILENTFTSSVTIQSGGRRIIISTSTSSANIDIGSNGITFFHPNLHTSAAISIAEFSTTATSLGPCVTGSTLSLQTSGGRVELSFTGTLKNTQSGFAVSMLQDGDFPMRLSTATAPGYYAGNDSEMTVSFSYLLDAPSAGLHNYCITVCASFFSGGTTTLLDDSGSGNLFYAVEIK